MNTIHWILHLDCHQCELHALSFQLPALGWENPGGFVGGAWGRWDTVMGGTSMAIILLNPVHPQKPPYSSEEQTCHWEITHNSRPHLEVGNYMH